MSRRIDCALVVQKGDHTLGYYDLATGNELARVPVDPFPHEFALTQDQRFAYLCHFGLALAEDRGPGGNTVSVVNIGRKARVATLSCGDDRRPHDIDLDALGRVYVLSEANSQLLRFDHMDGSGPALRRPTGGLVSVTKDGSRAYCSNMGSDTVTVVSTTGDAAPVTVPVGRRPEGSVLNTDESRLYVVNRESADISVIDTHSLKPLAPISTSAGPVRICSAPDGRLLVALYHGRGMALIDPDRPQDQTGVSLPEKAISISYDPQTKQAMLSVLGDLVIVVDVEHGAVTQSIQTRSDPDPTARIQLICE